MHPRPQCQRERSSTHGQSEECTHGYPIVGTDSASQTTANPSRSIQRSSSTSAVDAVAPVLRQHTHAAGRLSKTERSSLVLKDASDALWSGRSICLHDLSLLQALKDACTIVPIERDGFSTLEARNLADTITVRYDINHDRHIIFGSIVDQRRQQIAELYYSAVAFEIVLYLSGALAQKLCACSRPIQQSDSIQAYLDRLPKFFKVLRDVVKSLIRTEHGPVVSQAIDVDMIINQLRIGSCDLLSLALWLGDILKQACSPLRDASVDSTMQTHASAMRNRDGHLLAQGLSSLFDVFSIMKLDVINHQMRGLLPPLVDDSLNFVQEKYEEQIAKEEFDYRYLWKWFHQKREFHDARAAQADLEYCHGPYGSLDDTDVTELDEDYLTRWIDIVFEEVIVSNTPVDQMAKPFELDHRRIYDIRRHLSRLQLQQCQLKTLHEILRQCGAARQLSTKTERELLQRLEDIQSHPMQRSELVDALALEIVRAAYDLMGRTSKSLDDGLVCRAAVLLDIETTDGFRLAIDVQQGLRSLIEQQLFEEISGPSGISDLSSSQILDRYRPFNRPILGSDITDLLPDRIRFIAQGLAHITLTEWRVWAKLLWFKPWEAIFASEQEYASWQVDVRSAILAQFPRYRRPRTQSQSQPERTSHDWQSRHITQSKSVSSSEATISSRDVDPLGTRYPGSRLEEGFFARTVDDSITG